MKVKLKHDPNFLRFILPDFYNHGNLVHTLTKIYIFLCIHTFSILCIHLSLTMQVSLHEGVFEDRTKDV